MNGFESILFQPSVPVLSDVFGSTEGNMTEETSDMELHGLLDDMGFFDADEESMLLPTSDIQTDSGCVSPYGVDIRESFSQDITNHTSGATAPNLISSFNMVASTSADATRMMTTQRLSATVSSSSVATKGASLELLAPPSYYLATNKFVGIPLAPMPVSPTISGRPLVVPTPCLPTSAPATAALAALDAKPTWDASGARKRRMSDASDQVSNDSNRWVSEEEMEMRRYVYDALDGFFLLSLEFHDSESHRCNSPSLHNVNSERNRVHAKKSRQRKKSITNTLEDSLEALKAENAKLRESIYQVIGKAKTDEILERRSLCAHSTFIESLKSNRVVDKKTGTFLRGLRKKMQATKKKREQRQKLLKQQK